MTDLSPKTKKILQVLSNDTSRADEAIDTFDAAMYGDSFHSKQALESLEEHLARWKRRADEIQKYLDEQE